jgi:hypothetical protein
MKSLSSSLRNQYRNLAAQAVAEEKACFDTAGS